MSAKVEQLAAEPGEVLPGSEAGADGAGDGAGAQGLEEQGSAGADGSGGEEAVASFSPEQQEIFNREIGKKVARLRDVEESRDELREALEAKERELTAAKEARDVEAVQAAAALGVHPDYLNAGELQTLREYDRLQQEEQQVLLDPELPVEEQRRKLAAVTLQLRRVSPVAERLRSERSAQMLEDMRLGREAKKAGWKPGAAVAGSGAVRAPAAAGTAPADGQRKVAPVPPVAAGRGAGTRAPAAGSRPGTERVVMTPEAVRAAGGGRRGLMALYEKM